ncbi:palmitoyltransferase ZDHHC12 isoform X1 [Bufo gargarizans]|uniref:palmitoyltransferase ZDHHC12 isoform X1 n=1 Tax=Bufo gargarizans TaxID=30331 RepID=UPI001CF5DA80|nr:palmitoyltransferase ZDHHC12 isoform X1 [Bufo gargarizans]
MFHSTWGPGCGIRAVHTGLTCGVLLVLFLHDTDLFSQENAWIHPKPFMFVLLVGCSTALYYGVSLMDPGYVLADYEEKHDPRPGNEGQEMTSLNPGAVRMRRCGYCLLKQPMRSRHCKSCQRCVRRYDHHCPWISNCVGEKNHRVFILYLALQLMVLLWAFHIAWSGFHAEETWTEWLYANIFLLAAFIVIGIFTVVVSLLLVSHLYLISCNVTTWEFMSHHRISYLKQCDSDANPFDRGILRNLWSFFCTCGNVVWERVYFRDMLNAV